MALLIIIKIEFMKKEKKWIDIIQKLVFIMEFLKIKLKIFIHKILEYLLSSVKLPTKYCVRFKTRKAPAKRGVFRQDILRRRTCQGIPLCKVGDHGLFIGVGGTGRHLPSHASCFPSFLQSSEPFFTACAAPRRASPSFCQRRSAWQCARPYRLPSPPGYPR